MAYRAQANDDAEPIVQIRELKRDSVKFVLKNVDLAYASWFTRCERIDHPISPALPIPSGES